MCLNGVIFTGVLFFVCGHWTCVSSALPGPVDKANVSLTFNFTYANASEVEECHCSPVGSQSCDNSTIPAECVCLSGYSGPNCTQCASGYHPHGNGSAKCVQCQCDEMGSLTEDCDRFGVCQCQQGVGGERCNHCMDGFHSLTANGCQPCTCEETAIKCLNSSKSKDPTLASMCHSCLGNASWTRHCLQLACPPSQFLTAEEGCSPCQCNQPTSSSSNRSLRQCDMLTGKCPECEGTACPEEDSPSLHRGLYHAYIIASGAVACCVAVALFLLLVTCCWRRWRSKARRTPLPLWTIELRRDEDGEADEDEARAARELTFDDLDVMYLDDSYLMESSSDYFTESTDSINRAGYHALS